MIVDALIIFPSFLKIGQQSVQLLIMFFLAVWLFFY